MPTYSEMTDFEINKRVAEQIGGFIEEDIFEKEQTIFRHHGCGKYSHFDPCSSWADAGPIIEKHLIAIRPEPLYVGGYRWFARNGSGDLGMKAADQNPLRAAMVVFLMMQTKTSLERVEACDE